MYTHLLDGYYYDLDDEHTISGVYYPAWTTTSQVAVEIDNPQTPEDYLRQVYDWVIIADVSKILTEAINTPIELQKKTNEAIVRSQVELSITSKIE